MEYAQIVFYQLVIFVIYGAIGVAAVKGGILDEAGLHAVSRVVIKVTLPVMLFTNTVSGVTRESLLESLPVTGATAVMYLLLALLCWGMSRAFGLRGDKASVFMASTMFGNVGFIGIPIIAMLFPERGMLYIAAFTIVDQLLMWTLGITLLTPAEKRGSVAPAQNLRRLVNAATIAIVLAVIVVMIGLPVPGVLMEALTKVGSITSPLALIYLGGVFCFMDIGQSLRQKEFYAAAAIKMLVFPVLFFLLMQASGLLDTEMAMTMTILSAMPTMTSIGMLAKSNGCCGEYSISCIFVTTIACIITLPVVCMAVSALAV